MKANRGQIERALDAPGAAVRAFLLHGPDESQSRALASRLAKALGKEAERIDLPGAVLKADPARLSDEASAFSLFGGARHILVEAGGDEIFEAFEALMDAPAGGNPVVIVTGALRKDAKLLKRALADPAILAFASYLPEGGDADRLAATLAREQGLQIDHDVAHLLAASTGGDRGLLAREIEKLALFADAAPDRPARLESEMFAALNADTGDGDVNHLIDAALGGRGEQLVRESRRLAINGTEGIVILRALLRRLLTLVQIRSLVDGGESVESAMNSGGRGVFFKERATVAGQVARWDSNGLARAIERVGAAELAVKRSGSAGNVLVEAELVSIMRVAAARR